MNERKTIGQHLDAAIAAINQEPATPKTIEAPTDAVPICPHCDRELMEFWRKEIPLKWKECCSVIMCPHCRKVLGCLNQFSL